MPRILEVFEDEVECPHPQSVWKALPWVMAAAILYWRATGSNQSWWKREDLSSSSDSRMIRCSDAVSRVSNLARAWMLLFQFSLTNIMWSWRNQPWNLLSWHAIERRRLTIKNLVAVICCNSLEAKINLAHTVIFRSWDAWDSWGSA